MSSNSDPSTSSEWEPPLPEDLQEMLPQYEITEIIGRGGMGAVYKALQKNLDRVVAIKLLPETFCQGGDEMNFAARFKLEAQAMAKFSHPGIVSVFDFGETSKGQLYFVMEFVEGMDIHQYIKHHGGTLPQDHALSIAAHVLNALEYAHARGIVHRDIKPANILLNNDGDVKIADFGLAKALSSGGDNDESALTMSNVAVGTPDFVAPEALDSDQVPDHRADIYAVGVMLYCMLTGKLPRGNFDFPSEMRSEIDPRLDDIIAKAMYSNPDSRYSSASELRMELDPVLTAPTTQLQINEAHEAESQAIRMAEEEERQAVQTQLDSQVLITKKKRAKAGWGVAIASLIIIGGSAAFLMKGNDPVEKVPDSKNTSVSKSGPSKKGEASSDAKTVAAASADESITTKPKAPKKLAKTNPKPPIKKAVPPEPVKPKPNPAVLKPAPKTPPVPENIAAKSVPSQGELEKKKRADLLTVPGLKERLDFYLKSRQNQVSNLAGNYLRGLDGKLNQAADSGNLNLVKSYREEKAKVKTLQQSMAKPGADVITETDARATLAGLPTTAPEELADLRQIWTAERQKIRQKLDADLQKSLEILETQLTKSRDFANAEKIQSYRESFAATGQDEPMKKMAPDPKQKSPINSGRDSAIIATATKDKPYENSLGMKFVPVPITGGPTDGKRVLFSIWETRVEDYEEFIKKNRKREWKRPSGWEQEDDHPVVMVSWEDAQAFCEWLTELDRKKGRLGKADHYRLPSDHEWSCAMGIGKVEDAEAEPMMKNKINTTIYPWGKHLLPPRGAGNFYGKEVARSPQGGRTPVTGYDDGFIQTAPVGSFTPNQYGLYDMSGNVWERCGDWIDWEKKDQHVSRGGSWRTNNTKELLSSFRNGHSPSYVNDHTGFRCVLAKLDITKKSPTTKTAITRPLANVNTAMSISSATKDKPYENSLGMLFVPVPITGGPGDAKRVLFSIWETRVEDYETFIRKNRNQEWPSSNFKQKGDHPAINVSWEDATTFCEWLTEQERKKGKLAKNERYRLPTDIEWSWAAGIGNQEDPEKLPSENNSKLVNYFHWGKEFPPPKGAGNYYGEEAKRNPVSSEPNRNQHRDR